MAKRKYDCYLIVTETNCYYTDSYKVAIEEYSKSKNNTTVYGLNKDSVIFSK